MLGLCSVCACVLGCEGVAEKCVMAAATRSQTRKCSRAGEADEGEDAEEKREERATRVACLDGSPAAVEFATTLLIETCGLYKDVIGLIVGYCAFRGTLVRTIAKAHDFIQLLCALPNGDVVSTNYQSELKVWRGDNEMPMRTMFAKGYVECIDPLPNRDIAVGMANGTIEIWRDGQCVRSRKTPFDSLYCLAVLPNGNLASVGYGRSTIEIWKDAESVQTLSGHTSWVHALAVLPDGTVVSGDGDGTIKVWSSAGVCVQTLTGHTGAVNRLAVMPNGDIVSGSDDMTIKIWHSGSVLHTLTGHSNAVSCVASLPNGDVASASFYEKEIRVWLQGRQLQTLACPDNVRSVVVLPSGQLASGCLDGSILFWE